MLIPGNWLPAWRFSCRRKRLAVNRQQLDLHHPVAVVKNKTDLFFKKHISPHTSSWSTAGETCQQNWCLRRVRKRMAVVDVAESFWLLSNVLLVKGRRGTHSRQPFFVNTTSRLYYINILLCCWPQYTPKYCRYTNGESSVLGKTCTPQSFPQQPALFTYFCDHIYIFVIVQMYCIVNK